jgi:hypothetical protein
MSSIGSNAEDLVLNADGSTSGIKLKIDGVEKASISSAGAFTSTTIDATKLTGALPAISGASLTGVGVDGISSSADATAITIDSSERVGIGATSLSRKLTILTTDQTDVAITAANNQSAQLQFGDPEDDNIGAIQYNNATNYMALWVNAAERLRIDSSGNTNIVTGGKHLRLAYNSANSHSAFHGWNYTQMGNNGGNYIIGGSTATGGSLKFVVNNTTEISSNNASSHNGTLAMTIDSSGNTYFGGSSLTDGTAEIRGSGASAGKMAIRRTSGNNKQMIGFYNGSTFVGEVNTNTSSTTYSTSSDYRLKENVNYTWDATTRLKQLKPARFNFKANDSLTLDGFLAHEVSDIVPEAIIGTKDALDSDDNIIPQSIDQSKLVPLLVKTIQELEARLTAGGL